MRKLDAIIIGGGISGASALHWLARGGADVLLFERSDSLGGVIGSSRNQLGALVETGPNSAIFNNPFLGTLVDDLALDDAVVTPSELALNRYIMRNGELIPAPSRPIALFRSSLLSGPAKRRLLREPFIARSVAETEESLAQFVERRLGREVLDYAVNPFVSGIYAGRPERLSVRYAMPLLYELEQTSGSLLRGGIKRARARKKERKKGETEGRKGMFSFREGMGTLTRRIEEKWRRMIRTGVEIEAVERSAGGWQVTVDGERYAAPHLIVATEARGAAALAEPLDPSVAAALRSIEYPSLAVACALYKRESVAHPLDGFGLLIPEVERRNILGVIFNSTLFPDRAPEGTVLLTAFVGGSRDSELALRPREEMEYQIHGELRRALGISARPLSFDLKVWQRAIPQYNLGYGRILDAITAAEARLPGLHFIGNYRGGVSVGDCVKSSHELVRRIGVGGASDVHSDEASEPEGEIHVDDAGHADEEGSAL